MKPPSDNFVDALHVDIVLFDLDETLLTNLPGPGGDVWVDTLANLVAHRTGLNLADACQRVRRAIAGREPCDMRHHLAEWGVAPEAYHAAVASRLAGCVQPLDDGVQLVRLLQRRGYRLFPATTNGRTACIVKLHLIGLVDLAGHGCFEDLFGGEDVCPGGKSSAAFFTNLMQRIGAQPQRVLMVGDNPDIDLTFARAAGIGHVALRCPNLAVDLRCDSDALRVRRLDALADYLPGRLD